ncbi:MAG TPA: twin-arginine translocation signal domain-containing protein, partial [Gemmatimonadaceae bacterium]|nr:twin-arginine translocation signal domain-containing protein [Gemmatimonadaceae bacterium]
MRRRSFLRGVGIIAAGVAIGLRPSRARAAESSLAPAFQEARRHGKPFLVATIIPDPDRRAFMAACDAIRSGPPLDLAMRFALVQPYLIATPDDVPLLTPDRVTIDPPSLVMLDGERPRLRKQVRLDGDSPRRVLETFLRDQV